jgi:adenylate kinase
MRRVLSVSLLATMGAFGVPAQEIAKPVVLVLVGPPGAGKTTQATALKRKIGVPVITSDDLPKETLDAALRARIQQPDAKDGFILDGYPSTRAQADYLGQLVKELKLPPPLVIQIDVDDETVRKRLAGSKDAKYRGEALEQRLSNYHREMDLFRSYYPATDIWSIIGSRSPQEVTATIMMLLADRSQ